MSAPRQALVAGFALEELHGLLLYGLQMPLSGCPPGLFLDFRQRTRQAVRSLAELGVDAAVRTRLSAAAEELISRFRFGSPVQDERRLDALMERSFAAARHLDLAMADARQQLDLPELVGYSCGWAFARTALHARMVKSAPSIFAPDPSRPSQVSRRTYARGLVDALEPTAAFLVNFEVVALPAELRETAQIEALERIVELGLADPAVSDATAEALRQLAGRALAAIGVASLSAAVVEELERMYLPPKESAQDEAPERTAAKALLAEAEALYRRYGASQDKALLDAAIAKAREGADRWGAGTVAGIFFLNALAGYQWERFLHAGGRADLDRAIDGVRAAIRATPSNAPTMRPMLNNLGLACSTRFELGKEAEDIELALDALGEAVAGLDSPRDGNVLWWNNLANALRLRFLHLSHDPADLDRAIHWHERVLAATPPGSGDLAIHRMNLANTLRDRVVALGEDAGAADLERAVTLAEEAAAEPGISDFDRPALLAGLAQARRQRAERGDASEDLRRQAVEAYRETLRAGSRIRPDLCLEVANAWGFWAFERRAWAEAAEAFGYGIGIARRLFRAQVGRGHRESSLRSAQGLGARAAHTLVQLHRLEEAVEVLEAGSARLLATALESDRRDLLQLREKGRPELYERYQRLAAQLAPEERGTAGTGRQPLSAADLEELTAALDGVIDEIRQVPGYQSFLAEMTLDEISRASPDPVVYLSSTEQGGLALAVLPGAEPEVLAIPLPGLDVGWVVGGLGAHLEQLEALKGEEAPALRFQRWSAHLEDLLRQLKERFREPLAELFGRFDRLVLIPQGAVQLLPLHAAAVPAAAGPRLSYAPNARVLRLAPPPPERPDASFLLVKVSRFGKLSSLPFADLEAELIRRCCPQVLVLEDERATPEAILAALDGKEILHFCCHGEANLQEPLDSRLIVGGDREIRLEDLLLRRGSGGRFALLSACETGMTGLELPDEVIGWPAGFLQLGFATVVATLWPIPDLSTALLVGRFYHLWRQEGRGPGAALSTAQRWLRDSTNAEIVEFLEQLGPWGAESPAAELVEELREEPADSRPYSAAAFWAPFYRAGL